MPLPSPAHFGRQRGGGVLEPSEPYASYATGLILWPVNTTDIGIVGLNTIARNGQANYLLAPVVSAVFNKNTCSPSENLFHEPLEAPWRF